MTDGEVTFADLPSSSQKAASAKPRRPPTVTPKRFTRFFTPRESIVESRNTKHASRATHQLRDITKNAVNRKLASPRRSPRKPRVVEDELVTPQRNKRRKLSPIIDIDSSPLHFESSPCNRARTDFKPIDIYSDEDAATIIEGELDTITERLARLPAPIKRLKSANCSTRLLQRTFGGRSTLGRGIVRDACADWRSTTANFYTGPDDVYDFRSTALPFCTTACNANSLVALGDETGGVALIDSSSAEGIEFGRSHVYFKPHSNAIMDIAFSSDDFLMASASGDQTARITDMRTQQVRYVMAGHVSSVKQVRFQPGNDSVLATSSRDGSVQIWDLRCRGTNVPDKEMLVSFAGEDRTYLPVTRKTVYSETCIAIRDAHANQPLNPSSRKSSTDLFTAAPTQSSRRNEVSITAISFLPQGREHLLISASEANASIKLWDIRGKFSSRRGPATPVSSTLPPASHTKARPFGLNSLTLSGDGARLYSLCRDSTVYAYSTNHLILGHAPELNAQRSCWRPSGSEGKTGIGPMYGFRHDALKISSFYIKSALRKTKADKGEMLAVGSRDGCVVAFPTDESLFREEKVERHQEDDDDDEEEMDLPRTPVKRPALTRTASGPAVQSGADDIPIYTKGTALVRGHRKEVTGVSWTADGDLVSVSDDWTARCWREGSMARRLRAGGEGEGQRWNSGWAEIGADYDDDE